ncbi:MAG: di-trans,poly-cis-decaprenylcistransferase [Phycisphaeraceae bacterium]|nr:di-trans,poly-cis-decaprenylcistransferase [Phycisphaeraceae bacterium]
MSSDSSSSVPRHIAIIMDGNGRWAQQRGLPRIAGHSAGARRVPPITAECVRRGVEALTLYSFSLENWKRPPAEVEALMLLTRERLIAERALLMENGVRLRRIGRREGLPGPVLEELDRTEEMTATHTRMTLCLALNYGSRAEITDAVRAIARRVRDERLDPESIDEALISENLSTAGLPDPDLLIRTAGQMRLSNYLLWQLSYAELHVTETLWPDFTVSDLEVACECFSQRKRTYGGLPTHAEGAPTTPLAES